MVKLSTSELDQTFAALSDATRRGILDELSQGERTVTELAEPFDMSLPAVSKHVRVLESAGLLQRRVDGRVHWIRMNPKRLQLAVDWVRQHQVFWEQSLDVLTDYVEKQQQELEKI